jgi:hypothetical protein
VIAISYRREDSLPIAGRLYDRLQAKFGKKNVFMDFDSIPPGADFRQHIKQMIERSKLVIAIIGPQWLGDQPDASRRIDNPADFVRLEIGYALEAGIPVIPLLINTTPMPKPEMLPPDIQELAFRHALPLDSGMDFHSHAERLIMGIGKAMDVTPRSRGPRKVPEPTASAVNTRPLRKIVIWTAAILLAAVASAIWFLTVHRHEQEVNATRPVLVVEQPKLAKTEPALSPMVPPTTAAPSPPPTTPEATKIDSGRQGTGLSEPAASGSPNFVPANSPGPSSSPVPSASNAEATQPPVISSELSDGDGVPGTAPSLNGDGTFQLTREGVLVWNNYPRPGDEASWSGDRDAEEYATGNGTITWFKRGRFITRYTGRMVHGKLDGAVTNEDENGKKFHGTFSNGVKSADWSRDGP